MVIYSIVVKIFYAQLLNLFLSVNGRYYFKRKIKLIK